MTPREVEMEWDIFLNSKDPIIWSEHRLSYKRTEELVDTSGAASSKVVMFPISATRFSADDAAKNLVQDNIFVDIRHVRVLKPYDPDPYHVQRLKDVGRGIVLDSSYSYGGAAENIAYRLQRASGVPVDVMGQTKVPSVSMSQYEGTPTAERIIEYVRNLP
jgi:pyruvate/2-oxoglutarate/acetoin dehydrogenase E1 component